MSFRSSELGLDHDLPSSQKGQVVVDRPADGFFSGERASGDGDGRFGKAGVFDQTGEGPATADQQRLRFLGAVPGHMGSTPFDVIFSHTA